MTRVVRRRPQVRTEPGPVAGPNAWLRLLSDHRPRLSPKHMRVLMCLSLRLDWTRNGGYASEPDLAEDSGTSIRTVQRALAWAMDSKYLIRTRRGGRSKDGRSWASEWLLVQPVNSCHVEDSSTGQTDSSTGQTDSSTGHKLGTPSYLGSSSDLGCTAPNAADEPSDQTQNPTWYLWTFERNREPRWQFTGQTLQSPARPEFPGKEWQHQHERWFTEEDRLEELEANAEEEAAAKCPGTQLTFDF